MSRLGREILGLVYRDEIYSLQILLSRTQAGPGRTDKQEQEEISPNHVQRINLISVQSELRHKPSLYSLWQIFHQQYLLVVWLYYTSVGRSFMSLRRQCGWKVEHLHFFILALVRLLTSVSPDVASWESERSPRGNDLKESFPMYLILFRHEKKECG